MVISCPWEPGQHKRCTQLVLHSRLRRSSAAEPVAVTIILDALLA